MVPNAPPDDDGIAPPEAPEIEADAPQRSSTDSEVRDKDGASLRACVLASYSLFSFSPSLSFFSKGGVPRPRRPEPDKRRLVYPARHQERLVRGRFKAAKSGREGDALTVRFFSLCLSVKFFSTAQTYTVYNGCSLSLSLSLSCLLGTASGPATWPGTSHLVEAICSQLCRLHPSAARAAGVRRSRWALVLADYAAIREAVLASRRLMDRTQIQLFELNQRSLSQW